MDSKTKKEIIDFQESNDFDWKEKSTEQEVKSYVNIDQTVAILTNWEEAQGLFSEYKEHKETVETLKEMANREPTVTIAVTLLKDLLKLLIRQKDVSTVKVVAEKDKPLVFKMRSGESYIAFIVAPRIEN